MKHKQTKKLFYGKWPYKVTYCIRGISVLRERSFDQIKQFISSPARRSSWRKNFHNEVVLNSDDILGMAMFLEALPKDRIQTRLESNTLDIYTDSKDVLNQLLSFHTTHIDTVFSPAEGTEEYLKNKNNIIVKKLPDNRFKHKVFLAPHKNTDMAEKALIVGWIKNQSNLHITDTTAQWFITTNWNWDRRYIMAEDEKALLMLKLRCGNIVGAIYDYQVVDK